MEKQVGLSFIAKTHNGGTVDGNAIFESPFQLLGHDGDILGVTQAVTEGQTDELHILFLDVLHNFLRCVIHVATCFLMVFVGRRKENRIIRAVLCRNMNRKKSKDRHHRHQHTRV